MPSLALLSQAWINVLTAAQLHLLKGFYPKAVLKTFLQEIAGSGFALTEEARAAYIPTGSVREAVVWVNLIGLCFCSVVCFAIRVAGCLSNLLSKWCSVICWQA